jgi:hypothetical protein
LNSPKGNRAQPGPLWPRLSLLTLLTYNTWVLWRPANGQAAIFEGYLSEFSATDQPHHLFFRGGDLLTALIVLALGSRAALMWNQQNQRALVAGHRPCSRWWLVTWLGLLIFGLTTFLDSFFGMDCSPTLSQTCRAEEELGRLSLVHYVHTYTSVGAETGIVVSIVAAYLALAGTTTGARRASRVRRIVLGLAAFEVAALVAMMTLLAAGLPGLGYPQAVMVMTASIWFALVGLGLGLMGGRGDPATVQDLPGGSGAEAERSRG